MIEEISIPLSTLEALRSAFKEPNSRADVELCVVIQRLIALLPPSAEELQQKCEELEQIVIDLRSSLATANWKYKQTTEGVEESQRWADAAAAGHIQGCS